MSEEPHRPGAQVFMDQFGKMNAHVVGTLIKEARTSLLTPHRRTPASGDAVAVRYSYF